jgi:large subunit ribosomal protein L10
MKKEDKNILIDSLTELINNSSHFYLTDISKLNAFDTGVLRRKCFDKDIELVVVKNTLFRKALEKTGKEFSELNEVLNGSTSVMFSNSGSLPAKLIKEFRKNHDKPILKAAYVQESIYIGEEYLTTLINIKTKEELIGDIIALLQSPAKNVISALQSGGNKLAGIVKTLSEKQ